MEQNPWEDGSRKREHERSQDLENWLARLNDQLFLGRELGSRPQELRYKPFFIVGCARSGSTLLYQALANTGQFAFPTNLISRFHRDPYMGSLVHRVLVDMDRAGEIFPRSGTAQQYQNKLGKTMGADAPHEFNYLWRNYFKFGEVQSNAVSLPTTSQKAALMCDLAAMENVFQKPLLMKTMELNWHLPVLSGIFPEAVFIFIKRNLFKNAWSLLGARKEFFGTEENWYSYKPTEYPALRSLPPWEQTIAQVWYTERAVEHGLASIPNVQRIEVEYETFCNAPKDFVTLLSAKEPQVGPYKGPEHFKVSDKPIPTELLSRGEQLIENIKSGKFNATALGE
ncbi:MAG TPA: sulfotransferase [Flavobacteriales bacterium]|nr:sulfotransferase [Flavobacteriales bacterium]HRQ85845.1 sulfotransferase [Flavobacteriales bacterium]